MGDMGSQAHKSWDALADVAWGGIRPGTSEYMKRYQPAMRSAFETAKGLDETPAIYSGYGMARDQMEGNLNRMNMGQTGTAFAQRGQLGAQQAMAAQEAQTRARLAKQQAMMGVASGSLQGYLGAMQPLQYAVSGKTGVDMGRAGMAQQQQAAEDQMYSSGFGAIGNMGGSMMGGADKPWIFG